MNSIRRVERKIGDGWKNPDRINHDKFRLLDENNVKVLENDISPEEYWLRSSRYIARIAFNKYK